MKTTCLLNFLIMAFVIAFDFELSDMPYFYAIVHNAYHNSLAVLKFIVKSFAIVSCTHC
ncbi:hypothetical protein CLV32_3589 [Pedobacter duraquae]|uniref:Uncharacterized protein n=1 Tax=Pedobacter duraquae TaxID=425511 RepID=A0A4R6IFS3_9SPHI|nr:hypothetical protein CLV32_3589 [Pedobacter duraquae]